MISASQPISKAATEGIEQHMDTDNQLQQPQSGSPTIVRIMVVGVATLMSVLLYLHHGKVDFARNYSIIFYPYTHDMRTKREGVKRTIYIY